MAPVVTSDEKQRKMFWCKINMIHFQLKAVFHQLFVSVLIGILARKKKQATLSRKSYSRAFSEKENWSPESWSNLHAYENMKHMQVFSSYLKTNASVHMIIAAHTHFFNSLSWSMWCIKRALLYPQSVTYCIFYI